MITLFLLLSISSFSQNKDQLSYADIRKTYEDLKTDNESALPKVRQYIQKAKNEGRTDRLIQGYRDGKQFSRSFDQKIRYADSTISASLRYGDRDEISKSYLSKGILYYFNKKNYTAALDEYLKAFEFSKNSKDQFLQNKVLYHLGIVKSHLGYYEDAKLHFEKCIVYYEAQSKIKENAVDLYNSKKAYYNTLHQLTVINRYLKNLKKSDSLSSLGYKLTKSSDDFHLEHSYFLKCRGISKYYSKDYGAARNDLEASLPGLTERNDFAWCSVVYYYLGKTFDAQNKEKEAISHYQKIDSVFNVNQFILPEVTSSYRILINHYKDHDVQKELYYTKQLLKADSLVTKDFPYLSDRMHRDYDRKTLKEELEKTGHIKIRFAQIIILLACLTIFFFFIRYRKDRQIKKKYDLLQKRLLLESQQIIQVQESSQIPKSTKSVLSLEINEKIKKKIKKFEQEKAYTKLGISQKTIAKDFGTNTQYLSSYIKEHKGVTFTTYLSQLRISYITHLLNTDSAILKLKIEALAKMCGIASRQNFSDLFYEYNGIRPVDFIKNRKDELGLP
jgi:AraC-like DNA-binding protein